MKKKLTAEEYLKYPKNEQIQYIEDTENPGSYKFKGFEDDNTEEDNGALVRAKKRETDEKAQAKRDNEFLRNKIKELEEQNSSKGEEIVKTKGTQAERDALWEKKLNDLGAKFENDKKQLRSKAEQSEIARIAKSLNGKWLSDDVGEVILKSRTRIEYEGDEMKTVFLDKSGQKTLMNFDEFQKSLVDEPSIKAILKANNTSGSGASANSNGSAVVSLKGLSGLERVQLANSNPQAYQELLSKSNPQ